MRKILLFFLIVQSINIAAQTLSYEGNDYFLNGANIAWNYYGTDVGTHYQWGALYDSTWFETTFTNCQDSGMNCLRLWIHCDGRSSPEFDSNSNVIGLDSNFFDDFDDILQRAENHNIMIIPCLWSFSMVNDNTSFAGMYGGLHADLITDSIKTLTYINNALIPMVQRYANRCNLLAWEIMNEPEWAINIAGGGSTSVVVSKNEMLRFTGMLAEAIHLHSNKMVTMGSASLKWNSDTFSTATPCIGNIWTDSSIQNAYNSPLAKLDFYQIHYWDYSSFVYDPFNLSRPTSYWQLDKPTIVGEIGGLEDDYTVTEMLDNAWANGFSGVLFWSINGIDNHGIFGDFSSETKQFRDAHATDVDFSCLITSIIPALEEGQTTLNVFPNPSNGIVNLDSESKIISLQLYNMTGKRMVFTQINERQIDLSRLPVGIYLLDIITEHKQFVKKVVIN